MQHEYGDIKSETKPVKWHIFLQKQINFEEKTQRKFLICNRQATLQESIIKIRMYISKYVCMHVSVSV